MYGERAAMEETARALSGEYILAPDRRLVLPLSTLTIVFSLNSHVDSYIFHNGPFPALRLNSLTQASMAPSPSWLRQTTSPG